VIKLLLIDRDPLFCLGLQSWIAGISDFELVRAVPTARMTVDFPIARSLDLVVLDVMPVDGLPSPPLFQTLQQDYPDLPLLLLTACENSQLLSNARQAGVQGYCRKGTPLAQLEMAVREVASGRFYWQPLPGEEATTPPQTIPVRSKVHFSRLENWGTLGLRNIDREIELMTQYLRASRGSRLDRVFFLGRRRELAAARWLISQMLPLPVPTRKLSDAPAQERQAALIPIENSFPTIESDPIEIDPQMLLSAILSATLAHLQSDLPNLTHDTLELDILRADRKRELVYTVLRQVETLCSELRFSRLQPQQLSFKCYQLVFDLWQASVLQFFGKYSTLNVGDRQVELAQSLLEDADTIRVSMLDKIPLIEEFFAHLLFERPLTIDNRTYEIGSVEALHRMEQLLQNLILCVANAVVQPLLNAFADVEAVKQNFYDRSLISTREIERFRNELSWKYRLQKYIGEPKAIYESRHWLLVLHEQGIGKVAIYAPRRQELEQLAGIAQTVTLVLESRDAIAPRVRSIVTFLGRGIVYILTQVLGKGLGLIARGVVDSMNAGKASALKRSGK
jgi:CheY-like chemotaxis protein